MIILRKNLKIIIAVSGLLLVDNLCEIFLFVKEIFKGLIGETGNIAIIGGADGPTSLYLAGKLSPYLLPQFLFTCLFILFKFVVYLFVLIKSIKAVSKNKDE